jgi:hypothetical protein
VLHVRNANVMLLEHLVPGMQMQSTEFERKNGVWGGGVNTAPRVLFRRSNLLLV